MIDNVVNIDFQDKNGYSYLHAATQSRSIEAIKKLLMIGTNIDIRNKFGKTSLIAAISEYHPEYINGRTIIDLLIENGADVKAKTNSNIVLKKKINN